jgi:hypothetical protein
MDDRDEPLEEHGLETLTPAERVALAVVSTFSGRAHAARLALIDGAAGLVWAPDGQVRVAFAFEVVDGKIVAIDLIADAERLRTLDVALLN